MLKIKSKGKVKGVRILPIALGVAMMTSIKGIYALGLGDIELHSALNEPINAEIRLFSVQPTDLDGAVVRLGTPDDFARAGIEWQPVFSSLKFEIVRPAGAEPYVKVTSTEPVREPFLDFIVQIRWKSGVLFREYTMLVDPPVLEEEKPAPVDAPVTISQDASAGSPAAAETIVAAEPAVAESAKSQVLEQAPSQAPASPPRRQAGVAEQRAATAVSAATYGQSLGPTQRSDTLWSIASSVRSQGDALSVHQIMMALLKANPEAFYNGNINALKAGYILRIPDREVIAAISNAEAVREANRQYKQWLQSKGQDVRTLSDQAISPEAGDLQAESAGTAKSATEDRGAHLQLLSTADEAGKGTGAEQKSLAAAQAEIVKLRNELALSTESSDAMKNENEDLRARIATLEQQVTNMQRLINLKDEGLAAMQDGAMEGQPAPESGVEAAQPAGGDAATSQSAAQAAAPDQAQAAAPDQAQAAKEAPGILANPSIVGALVAGVLFLISLIWVVIRRRRAETEDSMPSMAMGSATAGAEEMLPVSNAAGQHMQETSELVADQHTSEAAVIEAVRAEQPSVIEGQYEEPSAQELGETLGGLGIPQGEDSEVDPLVEADVYLAYRRYEQAESLIKSAMEKEPVRDELRLKLMEVYYAARNKDAFARQAEDLYERVGHDAGHQLWLRAMPMGSELIPEHALFQSGQEQFVTGGTEAAGLAGLEEESWMSSEAVSQLDQGASAEDTRGSAAGNDVLDFNLDLDANTQLGNAVPDAYMEQKGEKAADFTSVPPVPVKVAQETGDVANLDMTEFNLDSAAVPANTTKSPLEPSWDMDTSMSDFSGLDFSLDDTDLLAGTDVVGTKLDLAKAYIDMGDHDSARDILKEVMDEGNDLQKKEAQTLTSQLT